MSYDPKAPRPNRRLRPYESIFNALEQRSRHPVEITYLEYLKIIESQKCHYCDSDLNMSKYRKKGQTTATCLDRKDTDKPYSVENLVPCCSKCNYGKGRWFTYDEWVEVGKTLKELYKNKEHKTNSNPFKTK